MDTEMIVPQLLRCVPTDLKDPAGWRPARREEIFIEVELTFAAAGEPCGDFQLLVATREAVRAMRFKSRRTAELATSDPRTLWVSSFDWGAILAEIRIRSESCAGATVNDVIQKLRAKFGWEYEDFEMIQAGE
jgi:Immunity protein 8